MNKIMFKSVPLILLVLSILFGTIVHLILWSLLVTSCYSFFYERDEYNGLKWLSDACKSATYSNKLLNGHILHIDSKPIYVDEYKWAYLGGTHPLGLNYDLIEKYYYKKIHNILLSKVYE